MEGRLGHEKDYSVNGSAGGEDLDSGACAATATAAGSAARATKAGLRCKRLTLNVSSLASTHGPAGHCLGPCVNASVCVSTPVHGLVCVTPSGVCVTPVHAGVCVIYLVCVCSAAYIATASVCACVCVCVCVFVA